MAWAPYLSKGVVEACLSHLVGRGKTTLCSRNIPCKAHPHYTEAEQDAFHECTIVSLFSPFSLPPTPLPPSPASSLPPYPMSMAAWCVL